MSKDKNGGGTEKDGSKSPKYCSLCYANGRFLTPPEVNTAQKMQDFCIQQMRKSGMNSFVAWLATRGIPRLERWKKMRIINGHYPEKQHHSAQNQQIKFRK